MKPALLFLAALAILTALLLRRDRREWLPCAEPEFPDEWLGW